MSKLIFLKNPSVVYDGKLFDLNENLIRLNFEKQIPKKELLLSGLNIINEHNGKVMTERIGFNTVYKMDEKELVVELSNDGSVWVKPKYEVRFNIVNGILEGEANQTVDTYEELVVPTVKVEEGYKFVKWTPEIPTYGELERNMVFTAIVEDKNIYFHCSGGGQLDGEIKQFVEDYSELTPPSPIADENYKFVCWMPEIPEEGAVETTNFYAVFESNIPDRLKFVENDLTDTQLGLVENYDLTMTTAEEITDCQLALVELYNLIMGGI